MTVNINLLLFSFAAGIFIGIFYFGGLWWTLRRIHIFRAPILWVTLSFMIRAAVSLMGFYFAAGGDWLRILACLFGFILVRVLTVALQKTEIIDSRKSVRRSDYRQSPLTNEQ